MAVGRISGPLLAQNLFRDNIPLAFYNTASTDLPVLYLDVQNGLVGIKTSAPAYELDVAGYINAQNLRVVQTAPGTGQGQIGNLLFAQSNIGSTVGDIVITPGGNQSIVLNAATTVTGVLTAASGVESWNTNTGSVVVLGGQGIQGNLFIGGITNIHSSATSISTDTGALVVGGGVGVGGSIFAGGDGNFGGTLIVGSTATVGGSISVAGTSTFTGIAKVRDNTQAYSTGSGAFIVEGGVGIGNDLWVGGTIHGKIEISSVTNITTNADNIRVTSTLTDTLFYPMLANLQNGYVTPDTNSSLTFNQPDAKLTSQNLDVPGTTTLGTTASDVVNLNASITGNIVPSQDNVYSVGTSNNNFAEGFFDNLYTNIISSQAGSININPADSLLQINANIRVMGDRPVGTAPVITNMLFVNMDGDDTNDGRAEDPSRACRTIAGAIKSPYYAPGTSIKVAPGRYLEQNPLVLLPYTSVIGTDLRTTVIEPINKTQDLFHVQSGCYLFGMQFLNGRSGLLPGAYANGYNRGAYAMAFPPQVGGSKIDVFHSPYIQNCTNQTGPWLYDGSMFQPNQTVQVPQAVGVGSWEANTTTITLTVTTGTIVPGYAINSGQQDPGFFNARTLALANKAFIQEQTVAYVNQIFPGFVYSTAKCFRDTGIILENILYDSTFGGNEKSREAGLSYWNGVVSVIAGQETQTTAAINFINTLTQAIITNNTVTNILGNSSTYTQIINTALTGGEIAGPSITANLGIITTIINGGPTSAPALYKSTGPDNSFVSAEILLQTNREFIQSETVNYINNMFPTFYYTANTCYRDVGLIVDAVAQDLLFSTSSQSTFAGIQYWNQGGYIGSIAGELTTTTDTINYISSIAQQIVQGNTVTGYQNTVTQYTTSSVGTIVEADFIAKDFNTVTNILLNGVTGVTSQIIPNSLVPSSTTSTVNAFNLLQANKAYLQTEAIAYISTNNPGFDYNQNTCYRDVGYMVDSISIDLLYGGNRQAIQSGVYYYSYISTSSAVALELTQVRGAYNHLKIILRDIISGFPLAQTYQSAVSQVISASTGTLTEVITAQNKIDNIVNIINYGPDGIVKTPLPVTPSVDPNVINAATLLEDNRTFIQAEIAAYVNTVYGSFVNASAKSYRDTGLVVDAISQDIILGGNSKSVEAAFSYWNGGYPQISEHKEICVAALNHAKDVAIQVIANNTVAPQSGNTSTQIINTYFSNGSVAEQAVQRNFKIITDVITKGTAFAPTNYQGGGLFAATGLSGDDVKIAPVVLTTTTNIDGSITITIDRPTVGFAIDKQLYFGKTAVFPALDSEVPDQWQQRRVDPRGGMGGMLVDGSVVSARSPIASMVLNAYTQVSQGGRGIHIINNGYAQLVSIFTIFCSIAVETDSGGIASITNSNSNFGDICLYSKGYGKREFSGTVYNPPFPSFLTTGQYYPSGFYPNNGNVLIFVPDTANRPHIALVMEVEPPVGHINIYRYPGFVTAAPNLATLTTGTLVITGIDTTDIAIGQNLYIRDQYGNQTYADTDTTIVDIGYQSITLSKQLIGGGGDPTNSTYFTLYTCGNAYYTVLSSSIFNNPVPVGTSMIPGIQGAEATALTFISTLTQYVISNTIPPITYSTASQVINNLVIGGASAGTFISDHIGIISDIAVNGVNVAPPIIKLGTPPNGAGSAITMIELNKEFIAQETVAYLKSINTGSNFEKCLRDVRLILQQIIYDLETGGNYNSVNSGLSYWSREGTYHLVNLEEAIRDPALMPDGSTVNFYQRSYMSASGYTFEYVGAGINYGSLPQVGRADPVQTKEVVQLDNGKVFFTSTDQNGDFRIGPGLVISQATGVLSGRTFTKSLFAQMTPFILAVEAGG